VLFICIPTYNEAPTIGVLLWQIRKVFQDYSREYEILVYNDGSSDATAEVLAGYERVLPLTILGGKEKVGYRRAMEALLAAASQRTRYARRDAVLTMQGDFTDTPETIPQFVKRFEGGADIVVGEVERSGSADWPPEVRRLRRLAAWVSRPPLNGFGITDPFSSFRLYRVSVVREALKAAADRSHADPMGWAANLDLLYEMLPHSRRTEVQSLAPRYDLRLRSTRIKPWTDAWSLFRFSRASRARIPAPPPEHSREASRSK
jgi:glycosyltransferase involved in cell wall biosynthesis